MQINAAQMFNLQQQSQEIQQNSRRNARQPLYSALCSEGSQAVCVCVYQKCQKRAFLCEDSKCHCRQQHKVFCSYLPISTLTQLIEKKKFYDQKTINEIEQKFDRLIDEISVQRDKIIDELKIAGLQQIDKYFLNLLDQQQREILSGNMVSQLLESLDQYESQGRQCWKNNLIKKLDSQVEKVLNIAIPKIVQSTKILNFISFKRPSDELMIYKGTTIHSMVLKETEQIQNLIKLFKNNQKRLRPNSFTLLYRASENDFKVSKFWENCDGICNILVLIKTSFGKIIGGFTPLSWKKEKDEKSQIDKSGHSFVFSISENAKFTLKSQEHRAIGNRVDRGPQFGYYDLRLSDSSNTNSNSCADIGDCYNNPVFEYGKSSTWERFTGNKSSQYFTTIEWQVHEVKF